MGLARLKGRRAIFYTIDAVLASFMLLFALLIIIQHDTPVLSRSEQKLMTSQDMLIILSEIRLSEINDSFIREEISSGNITDPHKSAIEQIGEYWATGDDDKSAMLIDALIKDSHFGNMSIRFSIDDDVIYERNVSGDGRVDDILVSSRMIAGVSKGAPITGYSSSAYLKNIHDKKTSSYSYFGGFVGQGNITTILSLPTDFEPSRLVVAELRIETPGEFSLYINDDHCAGPYDGMQGIVSSWNVTSCDDMLHAGQNNISLRFISQINTSYISGGFFKATYTTDTLQDDTVTGYKRYYFPEISGLINLYDAISVQGILANWTVNMTFESDYDLFFTFGNEEIFSVHPTGTVQNIVYSRSGQMLDPKTIPIRLSATNISNITLTALDQGLPADTMLVTDVSGSMATCVSSARICRYQHRDIRSYPWEYVTCPLDPADSCANDYCNTGDRYTRSYEVLCNATRLQVAQAADIKFINHILGSSSLHKVGLEDFSSSAHSPTVLSNNAPSLISVVNAYNANGATCTCCGINRARNTIINSTNKRYMIVLSDGDPTLYCNGLNDYQGSSVWGGDYSTGTSSANDRDWAIAAGQDACSKNITVYAIGFGTDMSAAGQDTMRQIACNSSLYFNATSTEELESIYANISRDILLSANFSSQTLELQGVFNTSHLMQGSYIDLYFEPLIEEDIQSRISVSLESDQFNSCNASIYLPPHMTVKEAYLASYSSNHWTKSVVVNGYVAYNLTEYGTDYSILGDPFIVQLPAITLRPGEYNDISLQVGDSPLNDSECPINNTLIYTALVNSSTPRTVAVERAEGCIWTIESISGNLIDVAVPRSYDGAKHCSYTNTSISYDSLDVYDSAVAAMLHQLDYNDNGRIFVDLTQNDLEIILVTTSRIAYMWGPSIARVEVWQ